jgi:cell pole-organizing protein PopZ
MTTSDPSAAPAEPSMDEILASIRRIISDDASVGPIAPKPAPQRAEGDDVLLLTRRAPPEPWIFQDAAEPVPPPPPVRARPAATADDSLLSPRTAMSAAAAFEELSLVIENKPVPPSIAVSSGGPTLEDITRDLLRPMLKAWLDENLPGIVRARVDEEIERIARGRGR